MLEHHCAARGQVISNGIEVVEKQSDLSFGPPTDATPEKEHRRLGLPAKGEERAKIRIGRDQDPVLELGQTKMSASLADCIARSLT